MKTLSFNAFSHYILTNKLPEAPEQKEYVCKLAEKLKSDLDEYSIHYVTADRDAFKNEFTSLLDQPLFLFSNEGARKTDVLHWKAFVAVAESEIEEAYHLCSSFEVQGCACPHESIKLFFLPEPIAERKDQAHTDEYLGRILLTYFRSIMDLHEVTLTFEE